MIFSGTFQQAFGRNIRKIRLSYFQRLEAFGKIKNRAHFSAPFIIRLR